MTQKTQGDVIVDLRSRRSHVEMPADCAPHSMKDFGIGDDLNERTTGFRSILNGAPPLDCSCGDQRGVIISEDTALLLMQAFVDMANERRVTAMDLSGAEAINRAFREVELIQKSLF